MRSNTRLVARELHHSLTYLLLVATCLSLGAAGCGSQQPAQTATQEQGPRRYALSGRVVSLNASSRQVVVDHKDIPGFMAAMTMPYRVKDPSQLLSLSAEDQITADVVVNGDDVHLENVVVVKKADQPKTPAPGQSQPASPQSPKH